MTGYAIPGYSRYELPYWLWLALLAMTKSTGYELPDWLWLTWLALSGYVWYPVWPWLNWLAMKCLTGYELIDWLWLAWLAITLFDWLWVFLLATNSLTGYESFDYDWLWLTLSYSRSWIFTIFFYTRNESYQNFVNLLERDFQKIHDPQYRASLHFSTYLTHGQAIKRFRPGFKLIIKYIWNTNLFQT